MKTYKVKSVYFNKMCIFVYVCTPHEINYHQIPVFKIWNMINGYMCTTGMPLSSDLMLCSVKKYLTSQSMYGYIICFYMRINVNYNSIYYNTRPVLYIKIICSLYIKTNNLFFLFWICLHTNIHIFSFKYAYLNF